MKGSFSQLASILNLSTSNPNINFNGISIDSRTIKKGNIFIGHLKKQGDIQEIYI